MLKPQPACKQYDPELWFPVGTSGPSQIATEFAKAVCRTCPIMAECRDWADEINAEFGIWGGTTESERRLARRSGTYARRIPNGQETGLVRALASQA